MTRPVTAVLLVLSSSCSALLGSFTECHADADCTTRGQGLVCVDSLCVTSSTPPLDPRCVVLTDPTEARLVRLGSIMPRSRTDGGVNATGIARERALWLAAEQLNPPLRQGIRGRSIELIACDSQSNSATAAELAQHLIDRGSVAIFTSGSSETIAAARVTVPAGVLQVSVSASAPELTDFPDQPPGATSTSPGLVWRTSTSDTVQARVIAERLVDGGTPRTAVLAVNDAYGQGLSQAFTQHYPAGQHATFFYTQGGDLEPSLGGAAAFAPQQLVIVAFPDDGVRILNGAATRPTLSGARRFFSDAAKSPSLFNGLSMGTLLEGAEGSGPAPAPLPSEARSYFVTQFSQRFGSDPLAVSATANAFDAMMCVSLAAWHAHDALDGATLAQGMARLYAPGALSVSLTPTSFNTATRELDTGRSLDVKGASGPLDFDSRTGEAVGPIEIWRASGGTFSTLEVVAP